MDHGPPDPKRTRLGSGSWSNGHPPQRGSLPPLPPGPPHQSQYPPPPPFARPTSQAALHHHEERRHHEPDFNPPPPDTRTHSVGAGPYQPFPPQRDPVVKRDQSAEPVQMHYHRTQSTGDITDNHVNSYPTEDPRRQGLPYETTSAPPVTTQPYRPSPSYPPPLYGPPNPNYERQPYEPPPTPGALREGIHLSVAYASGSGPGYNRRKAPRTSQACDACRAAKAKCDDPKPCSSCKEKDIECVWKTPEPKHGDKVQAEILETLRNVWQEQQLILEKVESIEKRGAKQDRRHEKVKKALLKIDPSVEADIISEDGDADDVKKEDLIRDLHGSSGIPRHAATPDQGHNHGSFAFGRGESPDVAPSLEEEEEAGKALLPGEPAIPVGHTTGAARLLLWPSVENFLAEKLRDERVKNLENYVEYPNTQENKHGLRLYGRGPGSGRAHSADGSPDDGFSDVSSSPGPESVYGQIGGLTPPPNYSGSVIRQPNERRGGAGSDGQLELDEGTVRRLIDSYLKHIHIMHPILDPTELHNYSKKFIKTLPPYHGSNPKTPATTMDPPKFDPPKFINSGTETPGTKRKRSSPVNTIEPPEVTAPYPLKPGRPQRSIRNAVLLLVLALGRICEHRSRIPDVLPEHESTSGGSPRIRSGYPSPMLASPVVSSQSSGLPSPQEADRNRSILRRQSTESYMTPRTVLFSRNLDVIPGLAYAAFATDIIGNEIGENTLYHVHANILASLYFGQLARPSYSHRLINNASLGLQVILRLKLDRLRRYKPDPDRLHGEPEKLPVKDNPLVFAFWTCLQLESDILAELDLPHSGITTLEMHMPWPNLEAAKAAGKLTAVQAESYQAQLYLRNHLNKIHQTVYGVGQMGRSLEEDYKLPNANAQSHFPVIEAMVESIPNMSTVAPSMVWSETDPPANDILAARLRAKYYGTEVITYRPFLKMFMNRPSMLKRFKKESSDVPGNISPKILNYTKLCIRALENSTRAFHGMEGGRLIVTNVWGTAHAQWGNVILLQTAYQDPILRDFIDKENLRVLVLKTLSFLREVADNASALMTDIRILEFAARKMGFLTDASSSFSSNSWLESTPQPSYGQ